ncbi:unnamed protein product, partial [Medioppia subpectinata]
MLFTGSLRKNLDPFDEHPDDELWSALSEVQLRDVVQSMPGQLDGVVREGGSNLSVGQRQLLILINGLLYYAQSLPEYSADPGADASRPIPGPKGQTPDVMSRKNVFNSMIDSLINSIIPINSDSTAPIGNRPPDPMSLPIDGFWGQQMANGADAPTRGQAALVAVTGPQSPAPPVVEQEVPSDGFYDPYADDEEDRDGMAANKQTVTPPIETETTHLKRKNRTIDVDSTGGTGGPEWVTNTVSDDHTLSPSTDIVVKADTTAAVEVMVTDGTTNEISSSSGSSIGPTLPHETVTTATGALSTATVLANTNHGISEQHDSNSNKTELAGGNANMKQFAGMVTMPVIKVPVIFNISIANATNVTPTPGAGGPSNGTVIINSNGQGMNVSAGDQVVIEIFNPEKWEMITIHKITTMASAPGVTTPTTNTTTGNSTSPTAAPDTSIANTSPTVVEGSSTTSTTLSQSSSSSPTVAASVSPSTSDSTVSIGAQTDSASKSTQDIYVRDVEKLNQYGPRRPPRKHRPSLSREYETIQTTPGRRRRPKTLPPDFWDTTPATVTVRSRRTYQRRRGDHQVVAQTDSLNRQADDGDNDDNDNETEPKARPMTDIQFQINRFGQRTGNGGRGRDPDQFKPVVVADLPTFDLVGDDIGYKPSRAPAPAPVTGKKYPNNANNIDIEALLGKINHMLNVTTEAPVGDTNSMMEESSGFNPIVLTMPNLGVVPDSAFTDPKPTHGPLLVPHVSHGRPSGGLMIIGPQMSTASTVGRLSVTVGSTATAAPTERSTGQPSAP